MSRTRLRPEPIRLDEIFAIGPILASRGFQVKKLGNLKETIYPKDLWSDLERNALFELMDRPQNRAQLLAAARSGRALEASYLSECLDPTLFTWNIQAFSTTFEWYIGELLVRQFGSLSSSFGVIVGDILRSSDHGNLGDFDVLSVMRDTRLLYVECKSSSCTLHSIRQTILRGLALHVVASIIIVDTGLELKQLVDMVSVGRHPFHLVNSPQKLSKFSVINVDNSEVYRWYNTFFVLPGSKGNLENRIRTVLRLIAADSVSHQNVTTYSGDTYESIGYSFTEIG